MVDDLQARTDFEVSTQVNWLRDWLRHEYESEQLLRKFNIEPKAQVKNVQGNDAKTRLEAIETEEGTED